MNNKVVLNKINEKNKYTTIIRRIEVLNLDRFIKPCNLTLVKSNGLIRSFETIAPESNGKVSELNIDTLVNELKMIRHDIGTLSNQSIILEDLNQSNITVHDNKIFLYDVSGLEINSDSEYVSHFNNIKINELFGEAIPAKENDDISKNDITIKLYGKFLESHNAFIEDYIKDNIKEKNLRLYLKKK